MLKYNLKIYIYPTMVELTTDAKYKTKPNHPKYLLYSHPNKVKFNPLTMIVTPIKTLSYHMDSLHIPAIGLMIL